MDLVLNNVQWLICHKTKPKQTWPKVVVTVWVSSRGKIKLLKHLIRIIIIIRNLKTYSYVQLMRIRYEE